MFRSDKAPPCSDYQAGSTFWVKYGYNMDKYIQKLNFDFLTNQRVMQLIAAIDEYRGKGSIYVSQEKRR